LREEFNVLKLLLLPKINSIVFAKVCLFPSLYLLVFFLCLVFACLLLFFQDFLMVSLLVKNREQLEMLKDFARRLLKIKSNMNSSYIIVFITSTEKYVNHFTASRDLGEHDHNANKRLNLRSCSWWDYFLPRIHVDVASQAGVFRGALFSSLPTRMKNELPVKRLPGRLVWTGP